MSGLQRTIYLDENIDRALRIAAAEDRRAVTSIVSEAVAAWLKERGFGLADHNELGS